MILTINTKAQELEDDALASWERLATIMLYSHATLRIPDEAMYATGVGIEHKQRKSWFIAQKQSL